MAAKPRGLPVFGADADLARPFDAFEEVAMIQEFWKWKRNMNCGKRLSSGSGYHPEDLVQLKQPQSAAQHRIHVVEQDIGAGLPGEQ